MSNKNKTGTYGTLQHTEAIGIREAASKTICSSSVVAVGPLCILSYLVLESWRTMATRR
jgi:hypothetical protein